MSENTKHHDFADKAFSFKYAQHYFEEALFEAGLDDLGKIGWDDYDGSVELYDLNPETRLNEACQKVIYEAGFGKAYCNHSDKWETHYSFHPRKPFKLAEGWRVKYGHKADPKVDYIEVEKKLPAWPKEWFKSGHVRIVKHIKKL